MRGCLIAFALAVVSASSSVRAEGRMRAVMCRATPSDDALLRRVAGQTVDLQVERVQHVAPLSPTLRAQLRDARELAQRYKARVVVWFRRAPRVLVVHVAVPADGSALVRRIASRERGAAARSASAEAAALVVRSALRALAAGGRIGVERPELRRAAPPRASPATPAPVVRRAASRPRQSSLRVTGRGGWRVVIDGASPAAAQGFALAFGLRGRLWRLELWGEASLPATLQDALTSVELARHGGGLSAGLRLFARARFELWACARVGVLAYLRSTVALDPSVVAAPSSTSAALLLGAGLRARLRPLAALRGLWLYAGLRADAVIGAPQLGYQRPGGDFVERETLWPVQPTVLFGVALETP